MAYAPIVLFVFNRPDHTKRVLEELAKNELANESELYIYSDGPKKTEHEEKVKKVREVINNVTGFKKVTVIESPKNKGLANSVIGGVTEVINKYGKVIVLEDDLLTQKYFLRVMNQMLDFYEKDTRIGSVTAAMLSERLVKIPKDYAEDVFFNPRPTSYGWGTWRNRWENVDWNVDDYSSFISNRRKVFDFARGGKDLPGMLRAQMKGRIDSWAVRWTYHLFKKQLITVQTVQSYVDNIGHDDTGMHSKNESYFYQQERLAEKSRLKLIPFSSITWEVVNEYKKNYSLSWIYIKRKLYSKFGILIKFKL